MSIVAEIKMVLTGRPGMSLRNKSGPIHDSNHYASLRFDKAPRIAADPVSCSIDEQLSNTHHPGS